MDVVRVVSRSCAMVTDKFSLCVRSRLCVLCLLCRISWVMPKSVFSLAKEYRWSNLNLKIARESFLISRTVAVSVLDVMMWSSFTDLFQPVAYHVWAVSKRVRLFHFQ